MCSQVRGKTSGLLDEAIDFHARALEGRRDLYGDWHADVALSLSNLGLSMHAAGDEVAAESLHFQALEMRRDLLDPLDNDLAIALNNFAGSLGDRGSSDSAIAMYGEVLDIRRQVLGENHLEYAVALNNLATAHENAGDYEKAEPFYRESLDIRVRLLEETHPSVQRVRNNLAVLLEVAGDTEQAEELLRAAFADDPSLPHLSKNLGDLYYRSGRHDDAYEAYERAVKLAPQLGDDVYFKLGNIAYKRLDREAAATAWQKALELNPNHELARTNLETVSALA